MFVFLAPSNYILGNPNSILWIIGFRICHPFSPPHPTLLSLFSAFRAPPKSTKECPHKKITLLNKSPRVENPGSVKETRKMACNSSEGLGDDFLEQILAVPSAYGNSDGSGSGSGMPPMVLQLGSGSGGGGGGLRESLAMGMPLGLNLEQGFLRQDGSRVRYGDDVVEGNNVNNHHLHLNNTNNNSTTPSSSSACGITVSNSFNFCSMLHSVFLYTACFV